MGEFEARTIVYRKVDSVDLQMHLFRPAAPGVSAAVVFFHGGGLTKGAPDYVRPECEYLASRGIVAATAAYRLLPHQARDVSDCIADAQAAIAWLRANEELEIRDVAACGNSAGGLLAGATAFEGPIEEFPASSRPDAVVLLNAVIDTTWPAKGAHLGATCPPVLVLHGRRDTMASVSRARRFAEDMVAAGHPCELVEFDGAHTFFRPYARNGSAGFIGVLKRVDRFLTDLGYLSHDASAEARIEAIGETMLDEVLAKREKRRGRVDDS